MKCEETPRYLADDLAGTLSAADQQQWAAHLRTCGECRREAEEMHRLWGRLGELPEVEPGPLGRTRFYDMLESYVAGMDRPKRRWITGWWPLQPAWQFAAIVLAVAGGWLGGQHFSGKPAEPKTEVAQLRDEVDRMRQMIALSLLQQQSASDRLRGVSFSYQVEPSDTEVVGALLQTVNRDPSVNVRLAAVDALQKFAGSEIVRKGLIRAVAGQDSLLTQIALVDALAQRREPDAKAGLRQLAQDEHLPAQVREQARKQIRE